MVSLGVHLIQGEKLNCKSRQFYYTTIFSRSKKSWNKDTETDRRDRVDYFDMKKS